MSFQVFELAKARSDITSIFDWISARNIEGANSWLDAYDLTIEKLKIRADRFSLAEESNVIEFELRQAFFKTRRGKLYRIIFFIDGGSVYIFRVRGPGQQLLNSDDL